MRRILAAIAILAACVPAAQARPPLDPIKSSDLWATVNVCDTEAHPDRIGIRASMPGVGRRREMWMRFQVHYLSRTDNKWHTVQENADSGYRKIGVAKNRVLESGHTFKFLPPPDGGAHTLRGAVTFVWKRKGRTMRRVRELTEAGHRSTAGADPPGFSAAICQIS